MQNLFSTLFRSFRPSRPVPEEYRAMFKHLYWDISWFGVLNGSILAFLTVYATRLGATSEQIGFIGAAPAVVALIFTFAARRWLEKRSVHQGVFWGSVLHRIFYLFFPFLPFFFDNLTQVWVIIGATLLMSVPAVVLNIGFNALFAEAVPAEWRSYVSGVRNACFSLTTIVSTIVCGQLLETVVFPVGYQVVFAIGFVGAAMSSVELWFVRPKETIQVSPPAAITSGTSGRRAFNNFKQMLRVDILRGPFQRTLLLFFFFHLFQYLAIPIFPIYMVNTLKLSDQVIGLGSGLFYVTVFIGSLFGSRMVGRWGNQKMTGAGVALLCVYPILLIFSKTLTVFSITSLAGGLAWSIVNVAYINYLLEKVPAGDKPAYLAWYHLLANVAILIGSLGGPVVAEAVGLVGALLIFGIGRFLAGSAILRWG